MLVVGELRRGVELLRRRDVKAGRRLSEWLDTVTHDFDDRIIPVTTEVCERSALLDVPDPLPVIDGLLAATALERDLVLVTRNTADVERTGVAVVNPFAGRTPPPDRSEPFAGRPPAAAARNRTRRTTRARRALLGGVGPEIQEPIGQARRISVRPSPIGTIT